LGKARTIKKKRIADKLLQKYLNRFTTSFEDNKRILSELMIIPSKQLRNDIAGYLTRAMKNTQQ
jgi:small subunit ribosomal protein S17e